MKIDIEVKRKLQNIELHISASFIGFIIFLVMINMNLATLFNLDFIAHLAVGKNYKF